MAIEPVRHQMTFFWFGSSLATGQGQKNWENPVCLRANSNTSNAIIRPAVISACCYKPSPGEGNNVERLAWNGDQDVKEWKYHSQCEEDKPPDETSGRRIFPRIALPQDLGAKRL